MSATKTKRTAKPSPMKTMRLAESSKKLEDIRFEQTREMTTAERDRWDRGRRDPGRSRKRDKRLMRE